MNQTVCPYHSCTCICGYKNLVLHLIIFSWWRLGPVRHTKPPRTPAGFPRYNFRTSTGNLFFMVETDPRPHLISQDSRGSSAWHTGQVSQNTGESGPNLKIPAKTCGKIPNCWLLFRSLFNPKKSKKILPRSKFRADSNTGLRFLIRLILTKQINKRARHHTLIHTNVIIRLSVRFKSPYTMAYLLSEFYIDLNFTLIPDLNSDFTNY